MLIFVNPAGPYLLESGDEISPDLVKEVGDEIERILESCEKFAEENSSSYPTSVGFYLRQKFHDYVDRTSESDDDRRLKELLLDWHLKFQVIDNSCRILEELSAKSWGDYKTYPGKDCNNLKEGYSSLVDTIVSELPKNSVRLSTPVSAIVYQTLLKSNNLSSSVSGQSKSNDNWNPPVIVTCENGARFGAQFVIVTCSLGVLKGSYKNLFLPALPQYLSTVRIKKKKL
jgi:spermine oxidase